MNAERKITCNRIYLTTLGLLYILILASCSQSTEQITPIQVPTTSPSCSIVDFSLAIKPLLEEFQDSFYKATRADLTPEQYVYERGVALLLQEELAGTVCAKAFPVLTLHLGAVFKSYEQALNSVLKGASEEAKADLERTQQHFSDFEDAYRIKVEEAGY